MLTGKKWFYAFMRRNPQLPVRQPETTSLARAKGFSRDNVLHVFDLLESNIAKFLFTPEKIFNVDKSGFSTMQKRPHKIVAQKGKHQVGTVASGERGVNTTTVCAVSAAGVYIQPLIIFKQRNGITHLRLVPFYATGIWPVDRHIFQEFHFAPAAALLPADTDQPSSSDTLNPETSLGTESDSEDRKDSSKNEDYESPSNRMKHLKKTLEQISPLPKLAADRRPTVSRRSRGRAEKGNCVN
jgi:hypothetical protein